MAEKQTDSCTGYTIPSNEEIVNEITKDLGSCIVNSEETDMKDTQVRLEQDCSSAAEVQNTTGDINPESDPERDTEENITHDDDDFIDEVALKDLEDTYNEDDRERLRKEAEGYKSEGNDSFKAGEYPSSARSYTLALRTCPLAFEKDRAVMYSNRAAAKMKMDLKQSAIEDCTKAIELNSEYLKAYFRRAQLYEETEKLDEALADYQKVLELDPLHREALYASKRLPEQINERNEKMKTEMMAKLKDLGNLILRPFGLSTENFQLSQDPNSGGYSVNFKQNPR